MQADEAILLLGFPPNSRPTPAQISEAYTCLLSGVRQEGSTSGIYSRVVRTGVARSHGGRRNHALIGVPFLFIILGTFALGGSNAARAYKRQKEAYPSHNPFLP